MLLQLTIFAIGIILVLTGGDRFVDASIVIANKLKIPRMIVGGTIVSLATTAPELVVSTTASYMGDSGIAVGNALGSAIANLGLIIGVSAILAPLAVDVADFRRRSLWMLFSGLFVFLYSLDLVIDRRAGLVLFIVALLYLSLNTLRAILERKNVANPKKEIHEDDVPLTRALLTFIIGAVLVVIGSKLLVNSGIKIAESLGIPTLIIGLTAVAVGTSLPELITAITSVKKRVADLSVGNIIGANVLNLVMITGASAMVNPLTIDLFTRYYAFWWMFIMIATTMILLWKKGQMGKRGGWVLISLYVLYNAGLLYFSVTNPSAL